MMGRSGHESLQRISLEEFVSAPGHPIRLGRVLVGRLPGHFLDIE